MFERASMRARMGLDMVATSGPMRHRVRDASFHKGYGIIHFNGLLVTGNGGGASLPLAGFAGFTPGAIRSANWLAGRFATTC
jgi:hypothetical protein